MVEANFKATMLQGQIVDVQAISNFNLMERYELEMRQLTRKLGRLPGEMFLWHGTFRTDPKSIYESREGFEINPSAGNRFAQNARYS